jgi:hypothetical protein
MEEPMSQDERREHLGHIRKYVEEEVAWGRANLKGKELENFLLHTVEHYLREAERLLGHQPAGG